MPGFRAWFSAHLFWCHWVPWSVIRCLSVTLVILANCKMFMKVYFLLFNLNWRMIALCIVLVSATLLFMTVCQSCPTLCVPVGCSTPGLPVHHHLPKFAQVHVHCIHRYESAIGIHMSPPSWTSLPHSTSLGYHRVLVWVPWVKDYFFNKLVLMDVVATIRNLMLFYWKMLFWKRKTVS